MLVCCVLAFHEIRGALIVSLGICNFASSKWERVRRCDEGRPAVYTRKLTLGSLLLSCADEKVM